MQVKNPKEFFLLTIESSHNLYILVCAIDYVVERHPYIKMCSNQIPLKCNLSVSNSI